MAFRYKMVFELVTTEKMADVTSATVRERFAAEFAKGKKFETEDGREGEILDSKIEVIEEIL
jgi:hypothetical protein